MKTYKPKWLEERTRTYYADSYRQNNVDWVQLGNDYNSNLIKIPAETLRQIVKDLR